MKQRIVFLAALLLTALPCWAQTSNQGTIYGAVMDETGAVVSGAELTLVNEATGWTRSTTANDEGNYRVDFLPPGAYRIVVRHPGFETANLTGIRLFVGQALRVNVSLKVGAVKAEITVQASVTELNTLNASHGEVIENRAIQGLPLNGREFLTLASLVPGAVFGTRPLDNPTPAKKTAAADYVVAYSGARGSYNSYYVDGSQNTAPEYNNLMSSPSVEAIQEFRVETSTYSARYGQAGGAIISVVTKSGTNAYHGSLYEYHRNKVLDALPVLYTGTREDFPHSLWNQFGGSIGGPIVKNKTFFFFNAEFFRHRKGGDQMVSFAPTAEERIGDVRNSVNPWDPSSPVTLYDPWTGAVIPSGILPDSLKNPAGVFLMSLWPEPNYPANPLFNLRLFRPVSNETDKYTARIDHNFGSRDSLSGSFNLGNYDIGVPGFTDYGDKVFFEQDRTFTLGYTRIFNPGLVNVIGGSYAHYFSGDRFRLDDKNYGVEWGFDPSVNVNNGSPMINLFTQGFSIFTIGGGPDNQSKSWAVYLHDDLSWQRASHTLQMGGIFWRQRYNWKSFSGGAVYNMNILDGLPGLWFLFGATGSAFTNLLAGVNTVFQLGFGGGNFTRFQRDTYALYFQDDWVVTPRLALNLGIRWEYERPFEVLDGKFMALDFETGLVRYADGAPGLGVLNFPFETNGTSLAYQTHPRTFAPRFGFAFRPFKSGKTVIRGGYGIFHTSEPAYTMRFGAFATPFGGVISYWTKGILGGWSDGMDHLTTFDQPPYGTDYQVGRSPQVGWITNAPNYPRSYLQHWNLTLGHDLGANIIVEVAYVGSKGTNLNGMQQLSTYSPEVFSKAQANYPGWDTAIQTKGYNSNYNALQVKARKTTGHGLSFLAAYTWSHALAQSSNDTVPQEVVQVGVAAGEFRKIQSNAGFDVRHRLSVAGVYDLPFGHGRKWGRNWSGVADKTLGGWILNFIFTAQSGFPFSVYDPGRNLPDRICDGNLPESERTRTRWFDPACFPTHIGPTGAPAPGNSAPNIIRGPGSNNWDLGIRKVIPFTERTNLEFRVEAFNIWNHPQLLGPTYNWFTNNDAGAEITQALPPRAIQFALKFNF